jgi:hypothetical protein
MREGVTMVHAIESTWGDSENDAEIESQSAKNNDPTGELTALLAALGAVLRDTIGHFEEVSERVTENVLTRGFAADDQLIVALQDFDRLQQEFTALGDVIAHCATASSVTGNNSPAAYGYEAIDVITLADIREKLLNRLQSHAVEFSPSTGIGEKVF